MYLIQSYLLFQAMNSIFPPEIQIEEFNPRYTFEVAKLISSIQNIEFKVPITLSQQPDLANIEEFYQKDNGNFWIAKSANQIVGTIALLDIGDRQLALRKMFVDAEFRGAKYSTAAKLLSACLAWAKAKKIQFIYLGTTAKFLAAHRFYEKNGFIEIKKQDLPQSFPVLDVDSKFYKYELPRSMVSSG